MLGRITFYKTHNDITNNMLQNEKNLNSIQNQIATQQRLEKLSDDPIAAAHGTRYASVLVRKEVFSKQNRQMYDSIQITEGYARQAIDIIQESRELAVRAANGTFTKSDRENMAEEINQFIEGLYALSNSQDADGRYVFGGTRTDVPPFRGLRLASNRMNKDVLNTVEYIGSNNVGIASISDVDKIPRNVAGSQMFWSRQTRLQGTIDALAYTVAADSRITINSVDIPLTEGDTVYSIIDKINSSVSNVQASLDSVSGGLVIQSNEEEQLWLNDATGDTLQSLGLVDGSLPPYNISSNANVYQETAFDSLIRLRDAMFEDNYNDIGGRVLASLDNSLESVLHNVSKLGAITERLDIVYERLDAKDIPNLTRQLDNQVSVDITEAIQRMAEFMKAQQAAYAVGSRIMNTTLLDFLQ